MPTLDKMIGSLNERSANVRFFRFVSRPPLAAWSSRNARKRGPGRRWPPRRGLGRSPGSFLSRRSGTGPRSA